MAVIATKKFLDPAYLKEGMPEDNLERLSDMKFSAAPPTACATKEIYEKVPYFKASTESMTRWSISLSSAPAVAGLTFQFFQQMSVCVLSKNWETNFFPVASECFVTSFHGLNQPYIRFSLAWGIIQAGFTSLALYTGARILFKDYSETKRVALLDKEYSKVTEQLIDSHDKAVKANDLEAMASIKEKATRLKLNIPLIEVNLKRCVRLSPENATQLIGKLSYGIKLVLGEVQ